MKTKYFMQEWEGGEISQIFFCLGNIVMIVVEHDRVRGFAMVV